MVELMLLHSFHRMPRHQVVLKSILEPFKLSVQVVCVVFNIVLCCGVF